MSFKSYKVWYDGYERRGTKLEFCEDSSQSALGLGCDLRDFSAEVKNELETYTHENNLDRGSATIIELETDADPTVSPSAEAWIEDAQPEDGNIVQMLDFDAIPRTPVTITQERCALWTLLEQAYTAFAQQSEHGVVTYHCEKAIVQFIQDVFGKEACDFWQIDSAGIDILADEPLLEEVAAKLAQKCRVTIIRVGPFHLTEWLHTQA